FQLRDTGSYEFSCAYDQGHAGEQVVFAVGPNEDAKIWKMVILSLIDLFGGLGLGAIIAAIVYRKRNLTGSMMSSLRPANS
ncbi:MAG: hypothetical protein ACRD36_11345, partial [Candidatus Acidiferrum sp.]